MRNALRSELYRVLRRRMPKILLAVLAGITSLLYFLLWLSLEGAQGIVSSDGEADEVREMLSIAEVANGGGLELVSFVSVIMSVILGASIIATEYNWGTIRTLLPRTEGRTVFLAAKLVTLVAFALVATAIGLAAALASSAVITPLADLPGGLGESFGLGIARSIVVGLLLTMPYMALAFMAGLLARSTAAGVGLGLAVFFLEGQIIGLLSMAGGWMDSVTEYLLTENASAAMAIASGDVVDTAAAARGVAVLLAYTAFFLAIAFWRFHRRDVVVG